MNEGPERIDYREASDAPEVHCAAQREHRDPVAEITPMPLWLTAVCGVALCWAGAYLGVFHGGFSGKIYNEYESSPSALFPLPAKEGARVDGSAVAQTLAQLGKTVYAQCQPCHQSTGLGVPGQFPPLAGAELVVGGEKRLIAILLKGLQGPITVSGKPFNGAMPAWEKVLTDKKIAAVASFVRAEWGNGAPEISESKVAAARKELESQSAPYTESLLLQIPADASLSEGAVAPSSPAPVPDVRPSGAPTASASGQSADTEQIQMAAGKQVYSTICMACHQPTGAGLPPVFPPLIGTEYVTGSPERLAAMILKGNAGPLTVDGKLYNNVMPGQESVLTDEKIAAVMTYVRASFGNKAPSVSAEVVTAARKKFADRKTPWTEAELKSF